MIIDDYQHDYYVHEVISTNGSHQKQQRVSQLETSDPATVRLIESIAGWLACRHQLDDEQLARLQARHWIHQW